MKSLLLSILFLSLSSCVGGTLSNHDDIEEFPIRPATAEEGKQLKRCLQSAHRAQVSHKKKTGKFYTRASQMPLDDACQGYKLAQKRTEEGYEITAQHNERETTVRWSVNQDGVIEEHLGEDDGELEL